jgi:predicted DNA-binding transcriptional regulator YafY
LEAETVTRRTIEPVGVFHENSNWYIYGFCHLRNDYRQFRTDRIHDIQESDLIFSIEHEPLEYYLKPNDLNKIEIKILVDKTIVKYIDYDRAHYGFVSEKEIGDDVEMTFMCRDHENGFARWYMTFGDYATILSPESVKHRVTELLELGLQKIKPK